MADLLPKKVTLVAIRGCSERTEIRVKLPVVIGRAGKVKIPHSLVSRRHCELTGVDGYVWAQDLGSSNGTFANGERIEESVLRPGDELTVGPMTFQVVYRVYEEDEAVELGMDDLDFPAQEDTPSGARGMLNGDDTVSLIDMPDAAVQPVAEFMSRDAYKRKKRRDREAGR